MEATNAEKNAPPEFADPFIDLGDGPMELARARFPDGMEIRCVGLLVSDLQAMKAGRQPRRVAAKTTEKKGKKGSEFGHLMVDHTMETGAVIKTIFLKAESIASLKIKATEQCRLQQRCQCSTKMAGGSSEQAMMA